MKWKYRIIVATGLIVIGFACDKRKSGSCQQGYTCQTRTIGGADHRDCFNTDSLGNPLNNPVLGCQKLDPYDLLFFKIGDDCENCNPNASVQQVSLSVQGNPTCAIVTSHSETHKTPGCWCDVPFYGNKCCWCIGGCYTTNTWTTTEYTPAPAYGSCP